MCTVINLLTGIYLKDLEKYSFSFPILDLIPKSPKKLVKNVDFDHHL